MHDHKFPALAKGLTITHTSSNKSPNGCLIPSFVLENRNIFFCKLNMFFELKKENIEQRKTTACP